MNATTRKEDSIIVQLWNKFFPYWPLFLVLIVISIAGAWAYLKYTTPLYQASASILIKDERKGSDEAKLTESLDYLSSKKIVENEIEVLRSKSLLKKVVKKLHLYASIYEEGKFRPELIYATAPFKIEYQSIDTVTIVKKVYFNYNDAAREVIINGRHYPANDWVSTEMGVMRFIPNPNYRKSNNPLFFTLANPVEAVKSFAASLNVAS